MNGGDGVFGYATSSDPAEIAAGAVGTATLAAPEAKVGDIIMVNPRALNTGLVAVSATVSAAAVITVSLLNPTDAAIDGDAQIFDYFIAKLS